MFKIRVSRKTQKVLLSITKKDFERIKEKIQMLQNNPRPRGCLQLSKNIYRIRVGRYRIIYQIDDEQKLIHLGKVDRRREDTYRDFEALFTH